MTEAERAQLAADYPGWAIFRRRGLVMAWLPHVRAAEGLVLLRDVSVPSLRARLETFDRVREETGSVERAVAAARAETGGNDDAG